METKSKIVLSIITYSTSPGPRYCDQGDDSGEDFYHQILNARFYEAYTNDAILVVDLDGPDGYASSFLDEAFGNLVYDFGKDVVKKHLIIKSEEEPEWISMLVNDTFEEWEKRRKDSDAPKVTKEHEDWYRIDNNSIKKGKWIPIYIGK